MMLLEKTSGENVCVLGLILWRRSICVYFIDIYSSLYAQQRRETDRRCEGKAPTGALPRSF